MGRLIVWALNHVAGEFWIESTNLRNFYSISLGAYPFPSWAKLIVYPMYLTGAWFLWQRDKRFSVIALTFLVGGPVFVALIGIMTPAYLVRAIQAFTLLSPLLLAFLILALPHVVILPVIATLMVIHILAIRSDYPFQKELIATDQIMPLMDEIRPQVVYCFSALEEQLDLRHLSKVGWVAVSLEETFVLNVIGTRLERCALLDACGPTVILMERSPRFQIDNGQTWMAGMDEIAIRYGAEIDTDIAGLRILIFQQHTCVDSFHQSDISEGNAKFLR